MKANSSNKDIVKEMNVSERKVKQPTILLKTREPNLEDFSSPKRKAKELENTSINMPTASKENDVNTAVVKNMNTSLKFIEDSTIKIEHLQDYIQDNSDFLVIGVVGAQGVGKSTVLNYISQNNIPKNTSQICNPNNSENHKTLPVQLEKLSTNLESEVFKVQTCEQLENCTSGTQGVDIFITPDRVVLLDCQPFLSLSLLDDLIDGDNKRTNLISEFIPLENSGEIQALQYTAFLMSICHILLVVQDWFFDSNVVRFIQTAEMLKPTASNPEDDYSEHFPHLLLIHNKANMTDYTPSQFKTMQKVYKNVFHKTKLQLQSNIGMGSGRLMNSLNAENCGSPINLFLLPDFTEENGIYRGHPPLHELIKRLRANLFGVAKHPLTHVQLTEKTWLIYCAKVWDTVKKSPFFVEYSKLMP
ncbi:nonsense-mediated mRNA decay factor SMG9 isoform X2 [Cylas formicarius]|nr:nonsense-mediated mRNA decay factor SMG9 isoform X2 [Cylas formicarius]